ncbi:hypothetical protein ACIRJR_18000 [Streptomyces sp. NPDC102402]|uniref:hypothetical protein n=1 Tax=Streptomyces sp. NPDC102402 TaxID=3366169 RepID=UPI003801A61E
MPILRGFHMASGRLFPARTASSVICGPRAFAEADSKEPSIAVAITTTLLRCLMRTVKDFSSLILRADLSEAAALTESTQKFRVDPQRPGQEFSSA